MDNKRWYKRISTCFWFLLATAPFWFALIRYLFMWFIHTDSLSDVADIQTIINLNLPGNAFDLSKTYFYTGVPVWLRQAFEQLLRQFDMNVGASLPSWLSVFMSWFVWVYFIELMVDFVVWLPRMCHNWMERWCRD